SSAAAWKRRSRVGLAEVIALALWIRVRLTMRRNGRVGITQSQRSRKVVKASQGAPTSHSPPDGARRGQNANAAWPLRRKSPKLPQPLLYSGRQRIGAGSIGI